MFENTVETTRHFTVLCFSEEWPFEMQPGIVGQILWRLSSSLVIFLKANIDSDSLRGEKITDTFICTSFVLQILRGSAKQDHFKYEPLCISHTKKSLKKSFHFPTFAKSELKKF